jgi:hypothetical protein
MVAASATTILNDINLSTRLDGLIQAVKINPNPA